MQRYGCNETRLRLPCGKRQRLVALRLVQPPNCSGSRSPALQERVVTERAEYRRGAGVCVINSQGLVFAARRVDDKHNTWQMPQGGIDALENPMVAALRELYEETGLHSVKLVGQIDAWLTYDFPTEVRHHLTGDWTRYRGQTQKWFLVHFLGDDSEVDLMHGGKPEFRDWCWMPLERLPRETVAFKQDVYARVAEEFGPRIERWLVSKQW